MAISGNPRSVVSANKIIDILEKKNRLDSTQIKEWTDMGLYPTKGFLQFIEHYPVDPTPYKLGEILFVGRKVYTSG